MKYFSIYFLSGVLIFSCGKKHHDDGAVSMSMEERDSLLIDYVIKEFYTGNYDENRYYQLKYNFENQLNGLRKDTSNYSHEASFKNYHFKSFLFDALSRPPFVVEITNGRDEFIDLFSFTDEDYYSGNSINKRERTAKSPDIDSTLRHKINFETNLNKLIRKLSLGEKDEVMSLTKVLCDLLDMKQISQDTLQNEIKMFCNHPGFLPNDSIYNLVKIEQTDFLNKGQGDVLMVRTQSPLGIGYWRFWIEEDGGNPVIRTAFFSDILFAPMYM